MTIASIRSSLLALGDEKNAAFVAHLIPGLDPRVAIGVRTPELRALARQLLREHPEDARAFLADLPHELHEENMLHSFLLGQEQEADAAFDCVRTFLPYVTNWAVCDSLAPAGFAHDLDRLEREAEQWITARGPHTLYTRRFGVCMHMRHFLSERFRPEFLNLVASIDTGEYYLRMVVGWYFAEALARQPHAALMWLTQDRLELSLRRTAIRKAIESRKIPEETKALLRKVRDDLPRTERS